MAESRIAVIGATGAVGAVTMQLLRERGYENVRAFASARSAGQTLDGGIVVEEAMPETLAAGDIDVALFSVGTSASLELVPHDHVVTKSFYLIEGFPGRYDNGRTWIEAPCGSATKPSRKLKSPAAPRIIQLTRSTPVTCSVTPCSTCSLVFTSRKKNSSRSAS